MKTKAALLIVTILSGGCSMVSSTSPIDDGYPSEDLVGTAAGSYFLAKHLLRVEIAKNGGNITVSSFPVQDRSAAVQIALNLSSLSDDDITINTENGILKKIQAKAVDRTADIIVQIAKSSRYLNQSVALDIDQSNPTTIEFDPFDTEQSIQANKLLQRKFSSCVEIEIRNNEWSPGCNRNSLGRQTTINSGNYKQDRPLQGVYYRRPMAHRVHVVRRGQTLQLTNLNFANISPIFRIDIDRTLFVTRETTIEFTEGAPTSIHVSKPSEGLAIAKLPLSISQAVVDGTIEAITNRKNITDAEVAYVKAQTDYRNAITERIKAGDSLKDAAQAAGADTSGQ